MGNTYDESNIKSLGLVGGIRMRPTMYIESVGPRGVVKLFFEPMQNSIDEASEGRCSLISIDIDTKTSTFSVQDDGAGIPIGALHGVMNELHTGGKFDNKGYKKHSGQNGVGLFVLNCLSEYVNVDVWRDGKHASHRYEKGTTIYEKVENGPKEMHGTRIEFKPDVSILKDITVDVPMILNMLETIASINTGLTIAVNLDGKKIVYKFNGNIGDYLELLMKRDKVHKMSSVLFLEDDTNDLFSIKLAFTFSADIEGERITSYVNNFPTKEGGTHVTGFTSAVARAFTNYMKKHDSIPKSIKNLSGTELVENIYGIVSAFHYDPQFDGQTKDRMTSIDYEAYCRTLMYNFMSAWLENNQNEADKLIKYAIKKAKAKEAARNAKELAMAPSTTKNLMASKIDLKKFTDCRSNDAINNELFILEGDSAGGSASAARDDVHQALLRLQGKVLNVLTSKGKLSKELETLVEVLGIGYGSKINYDKLKYHKIILMTDADPDGSHIIALLLTFFFTNYIKLIEDGKIFIATPPFYQLIFGKGKKLNILNERMFRFYKKEIAKHLFDFVDCDNKPIPTKYFDAYLEKLLGFTEFVDNFCIELNLDPDLLELIVRNFDDLMKGNYKQFEFFGFDTRCKGTTKTEKIFEFDRGFEHYYLRIDRSFFKNVYKPIYYRMCEFVYSNVKLIGKNSKTVYGGTSYNLCKIIDSTMKNKNVELKRYKGLGEMDADVLKETAMDPRTRKIVKVTLEHAKDPEYWVNVLMGNEDIQAKKQLFEF